MPKKRKKTSRNAPSKTQIEESLIENFVKLQSVMTNMSVKFDQLSDNITRLLELFEIAAKSFVQHEKETSGDADLLVKLDTLLDQNKTIANGLTLMEEKVRHNLEQPNFPSVNPPHSEEEMHGVYPRDESGKPKPGGYPGF